MLNKKAVSIIVGYVLLVTITLSLSIAVYSFLRFQASGFIGDEEECPEGVSLIIEDYGCLSQQGLNITLQNKGLFSIDGFVLRVNDREGAEVGVYVLNETGAELLPNEKVNKIYDFVSKNLNQLSFVEVQPFVEENGQRIYCKAIASQKLNC